MKLNDRKIRLYTINAINDYNNKNSFQIYKLINNKSQNIFLKILLIEILVTCFLICFYQIYNRINYYLSKPIAVLIHLDYQDYMAPPNIRLGNIDTEALRPFWKDQSKVSLTCRFLIKRLLEQISLNVSILDDLWHASNVIANLDYINITYGKKVISHTTFENGKITRDTLNNTIKLFNKANVFGDELVISLNKKFPVGHKLVFEISNKGVCNDYGMGMSMVAIDDLETYRYFMFTSVKSHISISYFIRQYNILNSLEKPCENMQRDVDKCSQDCFTQIYKKYDCRLPLMPKMKSVTNCSKIHDLNLILKVYYKASFTALSTFVTSQCNCKRQCVHSIYFLQHINQMMKKKGKFKFTFFQSDLFNTIFVEKYSYDKLQLLEDIGGNLGLFLGVSLLTLFNFIHFFCAQLYKFKTSKIKIKINSHLKIKFNEQLFKLNDQRQKQRHFSFSNSNFLYGLVLIFLLFFSSILIHNNFSYYFLYSTRIVVEISETVVINIPNLIFCSESYNISLIKKKLQEETNISTCNWHFLDLIDKKKILPDKLWSIQTVSFNRHFAKLFYKFATVKEISLIQYNYSEIFLHSGICLEFTFVSVKFGGSAISAILPFEVNKLECNNENIDMYVKRSIDTPLSTIKSVELIPIKADMVNVYINTVQLQRSNSPIKKCFSQDKFKKCQDECYINQLKFSINCRLPFIKRLLKNTTVCNSTASAKISYYNYLKSSQNKCNCHLPCNETIYTVSFETYSNENFLFVYVKPRSNFIENVIEELPYGIEALLCDIANNFCLTIGISVLSIVEISLKYISMILNCVISKILTIIPT